MTIVFRTDRADIMDYHADIEKLRRYLKAMLTDKDVAFIETGDISFDLGTDAGHLKAAVELACKEVYVTFYCGNGAFTVRVHEGQEITFAVTGHRLIIKKQALGDKEKEPDIDKIALKMCELIAGAQDTYNPVKDTKPASFPKIRVGDVACPLPAVVTLSLSEAEEMVRENKDELLARQRNDRKGIEYHLS